MNVNDFFASKYLGAADLNGESHVVQISRIETETLQDEQEKAGTLLCRSQKALLCNKTNALTIAANFGPDMNSWVGRSIELFSTIVQGPNGPVEGIRVRVVDQQPTPPAAPPARAVF